MFYVSDVTGRQAQYDETTFRNVRAEQSRLQEIRAVPKVRSDQSRLTSSQRQSSAQGKRPNPYSRSDTPPPKREPAVRASQIMSSPVVTLNSTEPISRAEEVFRLHRFRHLPISSEKGKLVGILSDRDLISLRDPQEGKPNMMPISEIMVTHVLTARPETEIRMIADIMFRERIGAMPIVDQDEELVGMITRSDILRTIVNKAPLELWT